MSCDSAGALPATRLHSDRSGFDRRACTGCGCCLTDDAARFLRKATNARSMLTSGTRAPIDPNHQDDVPHVSACGRKRQVMPLPKLSLPVCLQPPCASSCSLAWTDIVFHDRTDRPERVLCVGLATLARLTTPVAEKLTDSILTGWSTRVDGPLDVDFQLASRTFNA